MSMRSLRLLFGITFTTLGLLPQPLRAQSSPVPIPSNAPLELSLLTNPTASVTTAYTISEGKLTVPSLWWIKENSVNNLVDNWITYRATNTEPARVDMIVNQPVWSSLDYLQRYEFVNRVGFFLRKYNYNLRIFDYQKQSLANYTCNFGIASTVCNINLNVGNTIGSNHSL